ncbi:MAG: hypothetical protein ACRDY2_00975 [Acidimicrobiales bacterium]
MLGPRYVVLGLAPARASWFREVAQWSQASSIPVEFLKCVSAEELRARLASNRPFSAVLVDASLGSLDRDLIDAARQVGCAVIVVDDGHSRRDWPSLGASAVLGGTFDQRSLVSSLRQHAGAVPDAEAVVPGAMNGAVEGSGPAEMEGQPRASIVVAVCGSGGVGTSTVAMALAQGLAGSLRSERRSATVAGRSASKGGDHLAASLAERLHLDRGVLLADMARRSDLAVLHDARDVVPGLQELVSAHRSGRLAPQQVAALTFDIEQRGYHLLLGLRRACDWASIRPRSFEAAFATLRKGYGVVICDIEADFEGESDGGSADVEDRNVMSRSAAAAADVVLAVGLPGVKGSHGLLRTLNDLATAGVPSTRVVPVCNRAPRAQRARAEIATALAQLGGMGTPAARGVCGGPASPIFLPERTLDEMAGHAARLPGPVVDPLVVAVSAVLERSGRRATEPGEPQAVVPGSLGHFHEDDETAFG